MAYVALRTADLRRRCRRAVSQLMWLGIVLACASGDPALRTAPFVPPTFAIVEPTVKPGEPPHVTVPRAPSITARVVENGAPVADADVSISDGSKPLLATAHTDRDGIVHFAELEPGAYELWATHATSASEISRV